MRKQYTSEERSELVNLVVGGRATVAEAAARFGMTPMTAYAWLKRSGARRGRAERSGGSRGLRPSFSRPTFVRVLRAGDAYSGTTWAPIPAALGHGFWNDAGAHSGSIWALIPA
jgi:hypothetical protein